MMSIGLGVIDEGGRVFSEEYVGCLRYWGSLLRCGLCLEGCVMFCELVSGV